jgi:hypothetical protein
VSSVFDIAVPVTATAYYRSRPDGTFESTEHAQGAWSPDQQHMGPVSGLLVDALESHQPRNDLALSRVAFDILGAIPGGVVEVSARVLRPGRTIELLEAEMTARGRTVVRATAWRLATSDTSSIADHAHASIPGPDEGKPFDMCLNWSGGFVRSLEVRTIGEPAPGRATVWLRPRVDLVEGHPTTDLARIFGMIDTANGIAVRAKPTEVLFPNTDLTVHLFRRPVGHWLGLETEVSFGADGIGLTDSVLHDLDGPIGRSAQTLTVRLAN